MRFYGSLIAIATLLADQLHKWYMLEIFQIIERTPVEVTGFFNLVMVWNQGVSFGLFGGGMLSPYWFVGLALLIVGYLLYWLHESQAKTEAFALGLIIGGALGNVVDRLVYGAVADFFDFHVSGYHWPAFNIADCGVVVGAFLLGFFMIFCHKD